MLINETIFISQNPETIWNFWLDVANDAIYEKNDAKECAG
jgi:hypothetical protein